MLYISVDALHVDIQVVAVWGKDRVVNPMAAPPAPGAPSDASKPGVPKEAAPQGAKPDAPTDAKPAGTPEDGAPAETSGQAGEDVNNNNNNVHVIARV